MLNEKDAVRIRPHHGMCLAYFVGEGYSEDFSAHMGQVLASLGPDTPIKLTAGTDAICARCPNNRGSLCETEEKVLRYDRAVLDCCGLEEGAVLAFGTFTASVQGRILGAGRRENICGGCQWNALCAGGQSRWEE